MSSENDKAVAAQILLGTAYEKTVEIASVMDPAMRGSVTFSLPTGKDLARIAVIQHGLREGKPLDELDLLSAGTIVALATLTVIVRKAPDWWYRMEGEGKNAVRVPAPELIRDQRMIWDLWGEFVAFRDTFPGRADDAANRPAPFRAEPLPAGAEAQPAAV